MYYSFKKMFSLLIISSMFSLSSCNSTSKDITLNISSVKMGKQLSQDNETMDYFQEAPKEKDILLTSNIKMNLEEQEKDSFKLEKIKEFEISDKNLTPICWSNDENVIAIKHISGLKHSYDVYNINISNSEITKITRIDYVIPNSNITAVKTKKILFLKNFKLYTFNLKDNTINEIYDLNTIKKDLEAEYTNHYIEKDSIAPEIYNYIIFKNQEELDYDFLIKDDLELTLLFDISLVQGSNKYISIVPTHSNDSQIIRILDIDSKIAISSKNFNDLNLTFSDQTGFKYNKINDTFYICANIAKENTQTIYAYKLNDPNNLKEIKNISNIKITSPIICPDNENFYFFGDTSNAQNSIIRYNTTNDKLSVIFKDKPEGFYSSLKFINNTNFICFNYRPNNVDKKDEEFSFIGLLKGDKIKNIQKLPLDDLKTNGKRDYSIVLNDDGDTMICKTYDYYRQNSIDYTYQKFHIYKIDNINTVLKKENAIIYTAKQFLGTPYLWGSNTPEKGFDTSGFVQYVYKQNGITIGRITYMQINRGVEVSKVNLEAGDLVFFGSSDDPHHVGIYIGNNQFIHASRTGEVVKISPLDSRKDYLTARRILK